MSAKIAINGRILEGVIQAFILISVISFTVETFPNLSESEKYWLNVVEVVTVVLFTIEYIVRVIISNEKRKFIFSTYSIIDLVSILPYYLSLGIDLRFLRLLRILRLFRILKLVRYSKAIQRFQKALFVAKEELVLYFIVTIVLMYFSSVGIYFFEHQAQPEHFSSVFDSLWWAVATLTTVGYGDVYPITTGGRIFTFFILVIGLGVVAVPAGVIASALDVSRKKDEEDE